MSKYLIVEEGPLKDVFFSIKRKKKYLLGRNPDQSDFVLEDEKVSRKHALFSKDNDKYYIENLSKTNPVLVNNQPILKKIQIKEKDKITLGKTTLLFTKEPPSNAQKTTTTKKTSIKKKPKKTSAQEEFETIFEEPKEDLETIFDKPKEEAPKKVPPEEKNFETIAKKPIEFSDEHMQYDTIFEEEAEPAEPFNLISEDTITLKVIAGPNAGAEFAMDKSKSYIIGKDPESCDILFNDLSVSKNHAKVSISDDFVVTIEDLNSKNGIILNSKKIKTKTQISSKDLIVVGTTTFIILNQKEALETVYAPLPIIKEEDEEEDISLKESEKRAIDWKKLIIPTKHLVIGGCLVLTLIIMTLSFFSLFKSSKIEIAQKSPANEIKTALEDFKNVQFSFNPQNGKLFLMGHVLSSIKEKEMLYNLKNISLIETIENNIIIDEYVWKNINDLLSDNPAFRSVNIHSPIAGKFIVSGYLASASDAENLLDYLNANFPYIDKLENKIVIEKVLQMQIDGLLISHGFSSLTFQLANGEVILSGRYNKDQSQHFENFEDSLKKLNGVRSIKNVAIKTTADMSRIDLSAKYKVSGFVNSEGKNIAVIINDKILNSGDFLDEMKVTQIKQNILYLEKSGLKYKIDYKQ